MMYKIAGFNWDSGNLQKCRKHGVSRAEIEFVFQHNPRIAPDLKHSDKETRYLAIGRSSAGRALFVAFTLRHIGGKVYIRPISTRYMHQKEVKSYETQTSQDEER